MIIGRVIAASVFAVGVFLTGSSQAAGEAVETRDLIATDATGKLSSDQLTSLTRHAQAQLDRVLSFWSANSGVDRFGKIRVLFDVPRRDFYSCVFYWENKDGGRVRVVRVFGTEGSPQMMAHKLTSAVFPQKDKLVRNMMGILAETQVGSSLTFPMCGFGCDDWVLALLKTKSYIPLNELGPDHESWGMKDGGGGRLMVFDRARQHRAYAETASFGNYVYRTYGVQKIKRLQRLSQEKERPWQDVFGASLQELEANWLKAVRASEKDREKEVATIAKLLEQDPGGACAEAQQLAKNRRP